MANTQLKDHNDKASLPAHIEMVEESPPSTRAEAAAEQITFEKNLTFWKSLSVFWRSTLWIMYGQLVVFGYGIDGIIAAQLLAMPQFRRDYGRLHGTGAAAQWVIPATWQSLYGGISQLFTILGALLTGWMADKLGRRNTNLISCAISLIGVGLQWQSTSNGSLGMLTAGKAINGIPIGMWLVIAPLYASEVAPLKLRGWLTAITNICQFSGVILFTGVVYVIGPNEDRSAYQIPFAVQWVIPSLVLLTGWAWPESPTWLIRKGRKNAAMHSLRRLHGKDSSINVDGIFALLEDTIDSEEKKRVKNQDATYMECFARPNRHRSLICMFVYACQYLSGLIFVLGYSSYFYQLLGFSPKKSFLLNMLNNVSMFVANILSWPLISIAGRRPLIVWGQLCCSVALVVIGGSALPGTYTGHLATVSFMFVWGFIYQITLGTVAWTVCVEIPSLRLRSRTQGLANTVMGIMSWLVGFVFPYMFNPDAGNMKGNVGFIFGGTTFIGFMGCWLWLPETKGRTIKELDMLFAGNYNVRHFDKVNLDLVHHGSSQEGGSKTTEVA